MQRILVIEDDPDMGNILSFALRRGFGAAVEVVPNGAEGVERARSGTFDLVVCDMMLPGVDGLEVLRRLKRTEPVVAAPVIFVTAAPDTVFGDRTPRELGASGVITKPLDIRKLCARIEALLDEAALGDART